MSVFLPGRSYVVLDEFVATDLPDILAADRVEIEATALPVKELRATLARAYQRPYGEQRLLLIKNADELTEIHQNTLLKLLEEPPAFLVIILQAVSAESFLPTVRSRLHQFQRSDALPKAEAVLPSTETAATDKLQKAKDRAALTGLLKGELQFQLQQLNDDNVGERLGLLERAITRLERNANQKLVIDWLLLHWFAKNGNG